MASEREFQQKVRQLGTLIGELEQIPGGRSKVAARELAQLLMEVHGAGLERIMDLLFESGAEGEAMIARLSQDAIVRDLLLLYSLHPDDLETRVLKALDTMRPRLRKVDCSVELVGIHDGVVQLKIHASRQPHGSGAKHVRSIVEEAIYDLAPDIASLTLSGLEGEGMSGFVPLDSLMNHPAEVPVLAGSAAPAEGAH